MLSMDTKTSRVRQLVCTTYCPKTNAKYNPVHQIIGINNNIRGWLKTFKLSCTPWTEIPVFNFFLMVQLSYSDGKCLERGVKIKNATIESVYTKYLKNTSKQHPLALIAAAMMNSTDGLLYNRRNPEAIKSPTTTLET